VFVWEDVGFPSYMLCGTLVHVNGTLLGSSVSSGSYGVRDTVRIPL
jgi:hypothetical protein